MSGIGDPEREAFLEKASTAKGERVDLDFKERFNPQKAETGKGEWCELLKDIVAIANSGGGTIVFGVSNDGSSARANLDEVAKLDPAKVNDKIYAYTGEQGPAIEIHEVVRNRARGVAMLIGPAPSPLVFVKPGTYPREDERSKQNTAFGRGTLYVRHGAKSEPATSADVHELFDQRLERVKQSWLGGIARVVDAPEGTEVHVVKRGDGDQIQLTTDADAPVYGRLNPDQTHPYRRKELLEAVNDRLEEGFAINGHDVLCVKKAHAIDCDTAPDFCHDPKFGSPQYSGAFADYLVKQFAADPDFFKKARRDYRP